MLSLLYGTIAYFISLFHLHIFELFISRLLSGALYNIEYVITYSLTIILKIVI